MLNLGMKCFRDLRWFCHSIRNGRSWQKHHVELKIHRGELSLWNSTQLSGIANHRLLNFTNIGNK